MARFTRAIVRRPGPNFADGLTMATLGTPDLELALEQHAAYCAALERCGLELTVLPPEPSHPDAPFVEDTAVLVAGHTMLSRPGAPSRQGEVPSIRTALLPWFPEPGEISAPGTLDGGDICEAERHVFIGISERTNPEGARQLSDWLAGLGYGTTCIDIRGRRDLLHLKTGMSYLGDNRMVLIDALVGLESFRNYEVVRVPPEETYAANCLRVNDAVLLPAGYPALQAALRYQGYQLITLEMSEFQKLDGGLSCLSLRF
ncbi:MAG: arginine deiminase family protein [Roseiflexaceae bacterium]